MAEGSAGLNDGRDGSAKSLHNVIESKEKEFRGSSGRYYSMSFP